MTFYAMLCSAIMQLIIAERVKWINNLFYGILKLTHRTNLLMIFLFFFKTNTLITLSNDKNFVASESRKTGAIFHCLNQGGTIASEQKGVMQWSGIKLWTTAQRDGEYQGNLRKMSYEFK